MRNHRPWIRLTALLVSIMTPWHASGAVTLPPVLSSHMVLQRELPVPIWGTAAPGEKITVKFREQQQHTTADATGQWAVKLDPLKAGGPDVLTVSGDNVLALEDVLVGEVWLGSGQSNMETYVNFYKGDEALNKVAAAGPYPRLRVIKSDLKCKHPEWQSATVEAIPAIPALATGLGPRGPALPLRPETQWRRQCPEPGGPGDLPCLWLASPAGATAGGGGHGRRVGTRALSAHP